MISDELERQLIEAKMTNNIIHGFLDDANHGWMDREEALTRIVLAIHSQNYDLQKRVGWYVARNATIPTLAAIAERDATIERLRAELEAEQARTICTMCGEDLTRMAKI